MTTPPYARSALTSSVLLSGAYDDESDHDASDHDDDASDFNWDIDSDEGPGVLLWSAEAAASATSDIITDQDQDQTIVSLADLASSIASDMERLNIGVRSLETVMMGVVVCFWSDTSIEFVLQTDEVYIPTTKMQELCTEVRLNPFCMQIKTNEAIPTDEATSYRLDDMDDGAAAAAASSVKEEDDGDADSPVKGDDGHPRQWIPEHGYVNVLGVLYSQAPIIVGLHTEQYDLRSRDQPLAVEAELLDGNVFSNRGKRIHWLETARSAGLAPAIKRSRGEGGEAVATVVEDSVSTNPLDLLTGFADEDSDEWLNKSNNQNVICCFERERETGKLKEVRLALSLHSPRMREELQGLLAQSRDTL